MRSFSPLYHVLRSDWLIDFSRFCLYPTVHTFTCNLAFSIYLYTHTYIYYISFIMTIYILETLAWYVCTAAALFRCARPSPVNKIGINVCAAHPGTCIIAFIEFKMRIILRARIHARNVRALHAWQPTLRKFSPRLRGRACKRTRGKKK